MAELFDLIDTWALIADALIWIWILSAGFLIAAGTWVATQAIRTLADYLIYTRRARKETP